MKLTMKLLTLVFSALMLANAAYALSPRDDLRQMVEQLQKTPNDNALREKIIKLAPTLKPAPAVPDAAITFEGRAQFAFRSAKSEDDFLAAAREYEKAVAAAPWVPGYYADLCTIYEKADKFEDAKRHCGFYLIGLTDPTQITDVKRRIAGLEFGIEKANSPQARAERERDEFAVFLRQNEGAIFKYFSAADNPRLTNEDKQKIWDEAIIENGVLMIGSHNQTEGLLRDNPHLRGKNPDYTRIPLTGFTTSSSYQRLVNHRLLDAVMTWTFTRDGKTLTKEYVADGYAIGPKGLYSEWDGGRHSKDVYLRQ